MAEEGTPEATIDPSEFTPEELSRILQTVAAQEAFNTLLATGITQRQVIHKLISDGVHLQSRNLDFVQKELDILNLKLATTADINSKIEIQGQIEGQNLRLYEAQARSVAERLRTAEEEVPEAAARLRILQDGIGALRKQKEAVTNIDSGGRQLLKTLTGVSKSHQKSLGFAVAMAGPQGFEAVLRTVRSTVASIEGMSDILGSTLQKMQEMTIAAAKAVSSLNAQYAQQTSLVADDTNQLTKNWYALSKQFASLEDVNQARTSLATQSSRFIHMHEAERNKMIQLGTTLNQVGVDMGDFTQTVNLLQVGFGQNVTQMENFYNELHRLGQSIGFSTMQMNREYINSMRILAKYGQEHGMRAFEGLQRSAKLTGIAIGDLIGITDQFSTFEGAANIVGKFNAMLGGPYLSTIRMVYATDAERLDMLRAVFKQSGQNWRQMNEQERMMYAWSAGIKDMALAARLFGTTDAEFAKVNREQKDLADLALASKSVMDKLSQAFQRLAVAAEPLLVRFTELIDKLGNWLPKSADKLVSAFVVLGTSYTLVTGYMAYMNVAMAKNIATMAGGAGVQQSQIMRNNLETASLGTLAAATNRVSFARTRLNMVKARGVGGAVGALGMAAVAGYGAYHGGKLLAGKGDKSKADLARQDRWGRAAGYATSGAIMGGYMAGPWGAFAGGVGGGILGYATGGNVPGANLGGRFGRGSVMVADKHGRGTEIATPRGANVIGTQQTSQILAASQINREAMANLVGAIGRLIVKLDTIDPGGRRQVAAAPSPAASTVVLEIDGARLGEVTLNAMRDRHEIAVV